MTRPLQYCKSWFRVGKKPTELWTEHEAKAAHESGRPYCVLVYSGDRPSCFVEVHGGNRFVGVGFLDGRLREATYYAFGAEGDTGLFLERATHREFEGGSDQVVGGTTYYFKRDGSVEIQREQFRPAHLVETARSRTNLSGNYSAWPAFGEYEDIVRTEREPKRA